MKRALACLLIASSIPALARAEDAPAASSQRSKKKARKKRLYSFGVERPSLMFVRVEDMVVLDADLSMARER